MQHNIIVFIYADYTLLTTGYGHEDHVISVAFDSTYFLASGSRDKTIKLWDKKTGHLLRSLTGHSGVVWAGNLHFRSQTQVANTGCNYVIYNKF